MNRVAKRHIRIPQLLVEGAIHPSYFLFRHLCVPSYSVLIIFIHHTMVAKEEEQ